MGVDGTKKGSDPQDRIKALRDDRNRLRDEIRRLREVSDATKARLSERVEHLVAERESARAGRDKAIEERTGAQSARDRAIGERDSARTANNNALADRDAARVSRDEAIDERNAARAARRSAVAERDAAREKTEVERDRRQEALEQRDAARIARDKAIAERDAARRSRDQAVQEQKTALQTRQEEIHSRREALTTERQEGEAIRERLVAERDAARLAASQLRLERNRLRSLYPTQTHRTLTSLMPMSAVQSAFAMNQSLEDRLLSLAEAFLVAGDTRGLRRLGVDLLSINELRTTATKVLALSGVAESEASNIPWHHLGGSVTAHIQHARVELSGGSASAASQILRRIEDEPASPSERRDLANHLQLIDRLSSRRPADPEQHAFLVIDSRSCDPRTNSVNPSRVIESVCQLLVTLQSGARPPTDSWVKARELLRKPESLSSSAAPLQLISSVDAWLSQGAQRGNSWTLVSREMTLPNFDGRHNSQEAALFPRATNPLFFGLRIENESVLDDPATLEALRLAQPVACADAETARAVLQRGVSALVSDSILDIAIRWLEPRSAHALADLATDRSFSMPSNIDGFEKELLGVVSALGERTPNIGAPDPAAPEKEVIGAAIAEAIQTALTTMEVGAVYETWRTAVSGVPVVKFSQDDSKNAARPVRVESPSVHGSAPTDVPAIEIAIACDKELEWAIPNLLGSIDRHSQQPVRVHALGRNLSDPLLRALHRQLERTTIMHYDMSTVDFGQVRLGSGITESTMDRLALTEFLDHTVSRVIYLDIDVLVRGDLSPLFNLDLNGMALASRTIPFMPWRYGFELLRHRQQDLDVSSAELLSAKVRTLHDAMTFSVFNAGVLLLDLDELRRQRFWHHIHDWGTRFKLNDQDILNFFVGPRRVNLDASFHHIPWHDPVLGDAPVIVHYPGRRKPWNDSTLLWSDEWSSFAPDGPAVS